MARAVIVVASALCLFSLLGGAYGANSRFFVEGKVYCDTRRAQFVTRVSKYLAGARVRLECRTRNTSELTYSFKGMTDASGTYSFPVDGNRSEEICEIILVKSGKPGCEEVSTDSFLRNSARISLSADNGMATPVRQANPLGFMMTEHLPECPEVLRELGITPTGLVVNTQIFETRELIFEPKTQRARLNDSRTPSPHVLAQIKLMAHVTPSLHSTQKKRIAKN